MRRKSFLIGLAVALLRAAAPSSDTREFVSAEAGYVARFPKSWHLLEPGLPTLYISSFPPSRALRAVIVPNDGATISIVGAPAGVRDIHSWIDRDTGPRQVRSRTDRSLESTNPKLPLQITEVVRESIDGPETVSWYFDFSGHPLKANLSYWGDDPSAEKYRQVLRDIVRSLTPTTR